MLDYIIIFLSVICFAAQFAFTKLFEQSVKQSMVTTFVMLIVTGLSGAVIFLAAGGFQVRFSWVSTVWAVIMACIMIPYYMLGIKVLSIGSVAVYSMFMMLGGMLVPFFYGILFLQETVSVGKLLGTAFLTGFMILQAVGEKQPQAEMAHKKRKWLFVILCLLIFFINGLTGVVTKAHAMSEGAVDETSFVAIYCAMTAILGGAFLAGSLLKNKADVCAQMKSTWKKKPLVNMVLLGTAAYTGNFLQLLAADKVPASVQFPLVSGGVIVLSAVVSVLFKERLTKREWISVAGAFTATFLFAF